MSDPTEPAAGTPSATVANGPTRSPLHERHVALGAKLAPFGGWEMPLEYAGGGVLAEHRAVREAAGVFDVSHLGTVVVRGPDAAAYVDRCLTNDLARIGPGQAQYTLCCDTDGGVVDDLIVYLRSADELLLVPNAANAGEVVRRLRAEAPSGVEVVDRHAGLAVLAVQGPRSPDVLAALGVTGDRDQMDYMAFSDLEVAGTALTLCRTGYTGELGYELVLPAEAAPAVWDALLAAGEGVGLRPAGLGARDTLRTEMGYPLHGQDLGPAITPVMARSGWAVGWSKPAFWGREALLAQKAAGTVPLLRGLRSLGRGIPRPEMTVTHGGQPVGRVTSGTFSPTLRTGVGLALLERSVAEGDTVEVDVRGRPQAFEVVRPPFVTPSTR